MNEQLGKYVVCDATKCSGCKACELACFTEHNKQSNGVGYTVGSVEVPVSPKLFVTRINDDISAPVQCKHCEDAPCLNVCSKNAISRINGQVIIDVEKCIGCKDCMLACPFGAIDLSDVYMNKQPVMQSGGEDTAKAATKCDLCAQNPDGPACVRVCPNKALTLVDPIVLKKQKNEEAVKALFDASQK